MKKIIFIFLNFGLLSCSTPYLRSVAAMTQNELMVEYYDAQNCTLEFCPVKKFNIAKNSEREELRNNFELLKNRSKESKTILTSKAETMDDIIKFNLGHSSLSKGTQAAQKILAKDSPEQAASKINEIFSSIKTNFISPIETDYQLLMLPVEFFKRTAYNAVDKINRGDQSAETDPLPSTFWKPKDIGNADLYFAFGRTEHQDKSNLICDYDKAKSGWGVHAGFHVSCGDLRFKVKIGPEVHSASFNSRIYWALGYNVPLSDFVLSPKVKYNRRLLTEFNSRKIENFKLKLGSSTLHSHDHASYYSPFTFISKAVLIDNSVLSSEDFKKSLFYHSEIVRPEMDAQNYNESFEKQIQYLEIVPASYITKTDDIEIGAWKYDDLNHQNRRELKGLQLLAAWLGNFDMRMDNNRLTFKKEDPSNTLAHIFSDVGSGLGKSSNLLTKTSYAIDDMPWETTKTIRNSDTEMTQERLQIVGLMNIEVNKAFKKMSFQDGQWMVRNICRIDDNQLKSALIASGLVAAEARLAFEKLLNRRNQMVDDFELSNSLSSCLRPINKKLNFSEGIDGPFQASSKSGLTVKARSSSRTIINGRLGP